MIGLILPGQASQSWEGGLIGTMNRRGQGTNDHSWPSLSIFFHVSSPLSPSHTWTLWWGESTGLNHNHDWWMQICWRVACQAPEWPMMRAWRTSNGSNPQDRKLFSFKQNHWFLCLFPLSPLEYQTRHTLEAMFANLLSQMGHLNRCPEPLGKGKTRCR